MKRLSMILFACLALIGAGCGGSDDSSTDSSGTTATKSTAADESPSGSESSSAGEKTKPTVTVPKGISPKRFATRELEKGTGATAKPGDTVTVHYVGVGYDSEEEFDSSWSRSEPFTFNLGAGEVIKGWDQGVVGMKVGGRRELLIPGNLAYGPAGSPPSIGPNETLIFVIDLLKVE
jgi:peptidylprolyl isomerase